MAKDKNREPVAAVPQEEEGDEDAESEGEFEVESIVGHKMDPENEDRVHYLYRIRWVDYTEADDTWEPKESLMGGAEGILEDYMNDRKNEGDVFFKEGYRKSKVQSYLEKHGIDPSKLEWDAYNEEGSKKKKKKSLSTTITTASTKNKSKESIGNTSASTAAASIQAEKDKKRKQRESLAAEDYDQEFDGENSRRTFSNDQHQSKKNRRVSDSPLPIPLSKTSSSSNKHDRVEKENETQQKKKRSSSAQQQQQQQQDSEDEAAAAREMEQMKRSPLKEKKADQRKSEEPSARHRDHHHNKPTSADIASGKAPLMSSTPNKSAILPQEEDEILEAEEELPLGSKVNAKLSSWEDLLIVESLEQDSSSISSSSHEGQSQGEYKWFIKWNENLNFQDEWISNSLARKKIPQALLNFYEDHLKFKTNIDIDDDDFNNNNTNNGEEGVNGDTIMD